MSRSPVSLHGLCQDQMHVRQIDRPFDRLTKMAGETFSSWSTHVNKDALFVTATLSSIGSLFDRYVASGTKQKRRNRPTVCDAVLWTRLPSFIFGSLERFAFNAFARFHGNICIYFSCKWHRWLFMEEVIFGRSCSKCWTSLKSFLYWF